MKIAFDLDGTVIRNATHDNNYLDGEVIPEMLELVNMLYDEGHEIYFFTCRDQFFQMQTDQWLRERGLKFHYMYMSKPFYHIFILQRKKEAYVHILP